MSSILNENQGHQSPIDEEIDHRELKNPLHNNGRCSLGVCSIVCMASELQCINSTGHNKKGVS